MTCSLSESQFNHNIFATQLYVLFADECLTEQLNIPVSADPLHRVISKHFRMQATLMETSAYATNNTYCSCTYMHRGYVAEQALGSSPGFGLKNESASRVCISRPEATPASMIPEI